MRRLRRDERGLSLVEVLVVCVMSIGLLLGILGAFDAFVLNTDANSRLTAAQDKVRSQMAQMTRVLRNAAPTPGQPNAVLAANAGDVVVSTPEWPGTPATAGASHLVRYCLAPDGRLMWQGRRNAPSGATAPGTACPAAAAGWETREIARGLTNSASAPLFRFDQAVPAGVRSIVIALRADASGSGRVRSAPLRSAVFLRSRTEQAPAVTPADVTATCNPTGGLLQLGLTSDANGDPLRAEYLDATTGLKIGSGQSLQLGTGSRTIAVRITNVLGLSTLLNKQVTCP